MKKVLDLYKELSLKLARFSHVAGLVSRITIGAVFVGSGWGKLHHLPQVVEFFQSIGIPAAQVQAPLVALTELVCGFLVLIGLFTRLAAVPLVVTMIVATMTAKWPDLTAASEIFGIAEYLYIVILLHLVAEGPGRFSVDAKLQ